DRPAPGLDGKPRSGAVRDGRAARGRRDRDSDESDPSAGAVVTRSSAAKLPDLGALEDIIGSRRGGQAGNRVRIESCAPALPSPWPDFLSMAVCRAAESPAARSATDAGG